MIYLDHGATSFHKPRAVQEAVNRALQTCGNPGRGGHRAAMAASGTVYNCRELAARMFHCMPEQVAFTGSCTHGLNVAINTLVKAGDPVVISGFEHNAVSRPLYGLGAQVQIAGRELFNPVDTLEQWEKALKTGPRAAIFTHVSNVFGYILPVEEMASLCRQYHVPFILDAAQSAGMLPISLERLGADFIAMPGHKGLLGPMGTGLLLCGRTPTPLLRGGTGSMSRLQQMPEELPDVLEAGTLNVPGIAGLAAGLRSIQKTGEKNLLDREIRQQQRCVCALKKMGVSVFAGEHQTGTVSFVPRADCEEVAQRLAERGIAVRAGLHCAPIAHESAGTLETGTVRISFGHDASDRQTDRLLEVITNETMKKFFQ